MGISSCAYGFDCYSPLQSAFDLSTPELFSCQSAAAQQLCESLPGYTRTLLLGALQHSLFCSREPMGALVFVQRSLASKCPSKRP